MKIFLKKLKKKLLPHPIDENARPADDRLVVGRSRFAGARPGRRRNLPVLGGTCGGRRRRGMSPQVAIWFFFLERLGVHVDV